MRRSILLVMPEVVSSIEVLLPAGVHIVGSRDHNGPGVALIIEGPNVPRSAHCTIVVHKHRRGMSATLRKVPS